MNSIRPLATISVLAAVGVFLAWNIYVQSPVPVDGAWPTPSAGSQALTEGTAPPPAFGSGANSNDSSLVARSAPQPIPSTPTTPALPELPALPIDSSSKQQSTSTATRVASLPPLPAEQTSQSSISGRVTSLGTATPDLTSEKVAAAGAPPVVTPPALATSNASTTAAEFPQAWIKINEALGRNELTRAHLLASQWRSASALEPLQRAQLDRLLSELAGTVVYSTEHRLEPPHQVAAGEDLRTIAQQYEVPWQLLAKINGIASAEAVQPGQVLKVVRGPFTAELSEDRNELVLMLDDRYAGRFRLESLGQLGTAASWSVENKSAGQIVLRGEDGSTAMLGDAPTAQIRLASGDTAELRDILSVGSTVSVRR